jgi:hypothetical protein
VSKGFVVKNYNQEDMKNISILCVLILAGAIATQTINSGAECLRKLAVNAHFNGEQLPAFGEAETTSVNAAIEHFASLDSITQNKIEKCQLSLQGAMTRCQAKHGNCEKINAVSVGKKCPEGFVRNHMNQCTVACPAEYKEMGLYCEKPRGYVLRPYSDLATCERENKGNCTIWHVRYFAAECRKNFQKLGSTVCIAECPYGTEDHNTICMKTQNVEAGERFLYQLADN